MKRFKLILSLWGFLLCYACQDTSQSTTSEGLPEGTQVPIEYATGLEIEEYDTYRIIRVSHPWPGAEESFTYVLQERGSTLPEGLSYDQKVLVPVKQVVVTSTTHVPSLEILGEEKSLVGFPGLDYISSPDTRRRIAAGKIQELGQNETLNTESLLELQPDVVIGFSIDGGNKSYQTIEKSGIPVIFNGDWTETSPLGKAEWIKFFGALFGKLDQAVKAFEKLETDYHQARTLAEKTGSRPTVLAGAMYKDQWFLPAGDSWQAQFIEDANAQYLFADSEGSGSLSLSIETVLAKAEQADFWVGPAQFTSYSQLAASSPHYTRFQAFQKRNIFTFSSEKGATGGVLFYELAPNRPDLVLKDLISILHPDVLPGYEPTFYKPLAK